MKVAVCTVGIDGWREYTAPLIASFIMNEPECIISVIDNASEEPYPEVPKVYIKRVEERVCYGRGLNMAADMALEANGGIDWFLFLGNDTLCAGPFFERLRQAPLDIIGGPGIFKIIHYTFVSGWGMVVPRTAWDLIGRLDENYIVSAWEDVDYSYRAQLAGLRLYNFVDWPIIHVDQQQRQKMFPINRVHIWNGAYFERKHEIPLPLCRYSGGELLKEKWV